MAGKKRNLETSKFHSKTQHDFNVTFENYTKAIWNLAQSRNDVRNTDLAAYLGVTRASVTGMLRKLEAQGYVTKKSASAPILLSTKGKVFALEILRKHRLVEMFLARTLKLSGLELHDEAEILEHAISPSLLERIDEFLKYPVRDDSGMGIPRPGLPRHADFDPGLLSLMEARPGTHVKVVSIADYDGKLMSELSSSGLGVGRKLAIVAIQPGNFVHLELQPKKSVVISRDAAALVRVTEVV